jgi:hypothetical protein
VTGRERTPLGALLVLVVLALWLGVWSGDGWRWGPDWLSDVAGFQALWALGAFGTGLTLGRLFRSALGGAAFAGLALAAYYVDMVLVQSLHSATSQLAGSGRFWWPAALVGGGLMGVLGALARRGSAFGWAAAAAIPLVEAAYILGWQDRFAVSADTDALLLVVGGLVVGALGVRRAGARDFALAALVVVVLAPVLGVAFLAVEHLLGYTTI